MNDQSLARASRHAETQRALRFLALAAVIVGVLVLAAAAFVLSYPGIHALHQSLALPPCSPGYIRRHLRRDADRGLAAILSLRGAGVATRCYAWFSLLLLICAAAAADALHATGTSLPHRAAAATVAIIPWVLVLLGFGLLLAMLRNARLRRAHAAQARANAAPPAERPPAVARVPEPAPEPAAATEPGPPVEPTATEPAPPAEAATATVAAAPVAAPRRV